MPQINLWIVLLPLIAAVVVGLFGKPTIINNVLSFCAVPFILAKGAKYWIFEFLYAKKDRDNITADELLAFRLLAKSYAGLAEPKLNQLLAANDLLEICHDSESQI